MSAKPLDPSALFAARTRVMILRGSGQHDTADVLQGLLAEVDRLTKAINRVEAFADDLSRMGTVSVYESAAELGGFVREALADDTEVTP